MDRLLIVKNSSSAPVDEETEEDRKILKEQQKFMKELEDKKIQPAAKIIRLNEKKSEEEHTASTSNAVEIDESDMQIVNVFEDIPKGITVGPIVKKHKRNKPWRKVPLNCDVNGFPKARRRDVSIHYNKSESIFSQEMKMSKKSGDNSPSTSKPGQKTIIVIDDEDKFKTDMEFNTYSRIITGSKILSAEEKEKINEENLNKLKSIPESEIHEERERLLSTMDPAILAYLKSKRKESKTQSSNLSISQQNKEGENINLESIKTTVEILDLPGSENWLNFDVLETHKLAWMKEVEISKIDKNKVFEARFDFEGWLLPFTEPEVNEKNRILYHHGAEPDRPGYTLQELFTLARSSLSQQKIIALNSIANILTIYSNGVYQDILDIPIEQLFFLIRYCMDDNSPMVAITSIKAMRCLIYNYSDEICLDSLLGFGFEMMTPVLPVDNEKRDDDMENDQQLVEKNLIRCLVRTGIYEKIRYIIDRMKPPTETIIYCLEILIRLSQDSDFVVEQMFRCDGLISSIVENFIPKSYSYGAREHTYGVPVLQAVKLVRLLSLRSENYAVKFVEAYGIVDRISRYINDETLSLNAPGIKLQTECFHLWDILLRYSSTSNFSLETDYILQGTLMKHLDYHIKNTNIGDKTTYIRESHCAAVLLLLGTFLFKRPSLEEYFSDLFSLALKKWTTQFKTNTDFKCGKSQIISSLLILSTKVYELTKQRRSIDESVASILLHGFRISDQDIKSCSMLLNNYEPHPFSANLKTLQTCAWYTVDHVIPIMQTSSCLPFIRSLSEYVARCRSAVVKRAFLENKAIKAYIEALAKGNQLYLTSHWFTRIESQLIINILKISIDIHLEIDTSIFYALMIKSLCIFNEDQKQAIKSLMESTIFSSEYYPSDVLLRSLSLNERNESLEISLNNLKEIKEVYFHVLGLSKPKPVSFGFCLDVGIGNIIPVDWIYSPILVLYSNQEDNKNVLSEEEQIFIVKNCLRWVLIYETYFPNLIKEVNSTDRFCRLACVFLGSDQLFLNNEIHQLLELCFKNISKFEDKLDFNKPVNGLKSFQGFYNQMLEQYQAVSYGDTLFGNFVMVPLSQKHNVQWRKTLWSEYMGVVQFLNISKEELMTSLDNYLQPIEEDESLLNCYKNAILMKTVKPSSVLHLIANHHYCEYVKKKLH